MSELQKNPPPILQAPPEGFGPEVDWKNQPTPTAPPGGRMKRNLPAQIVPIEQWLQGLAADEGLLLDICVERAIKIIEYNHRANAVGIDLLNDNWNHAAVMSLAVPLALKLYDACDKALVTRRGEPGGLDELIKKVQDGESKIIQ